MLATTLSRSDVSSTDSTVRWSPENSSDHLLDQVGERRVCQHHHGAVTTAAPRSPAGAGCRALAQPAPDASPESSAAHQRRRPTTARPARRARRRTRRSGTGSRSASRTGRGGWLAEWGAACGWTVPGRAAEPPETRVRPADGSPRERTLRQVQRWIITRQVDEPSSRRGTSRATSTAPSPTVTSAVERSRMPALTSSTRTAPAASAAPGSRR